jgi:predicted flavoprotein YhiN
VTESAQTIRDALATELDKHHVTIKTNAPVAAIRNEKDTFLIQLTDGQTLTADTCVVATGGSARPETGSTGEGFEWFKSLGHTVVENSFALVPITLKTAWSKKHSGITVPECKITFWPMVKNTVQ